jgi:hypothetical protein
MTVYFTRGWPVEAEVWIGEHEITIVAIDGTPKTGRSNGRNRMQPPKIKTHEHGPFCHDFNSFNFLQCECCRFSSWTCRLNESPEWGAEFATCMIPAVHFTLFYYQTSCTRPRVAVALSGDWLNDIVTLSSSTSLSLPERIARSPSQSWVFCWRHTIYRDSFPLEC